MNFNLRSNERMQIYSFLEFKVMLSKIAKLSNNERKVLIQKCGQLVQKRHLIVNFDLACRNDGLDIAMELASTI